MSTYLTVQHTYEEVQIGLFQNNTCIQKQSIHKHDASSLLAPSVATLLSKNGLNLTQLSFIALNQGPGPFTTLRVVISSINALSFAVGLPMVGVDGMKALVSEAAARKTVCIALLNAFNQDVYFGIADKNNRVQTGYDNIEYLLNRIQKEYAEQPICFFGNGAQLYQKAITQQFPNAKIDNSIVYSSLEEIAHQAYIKWRNKEYSTTQLQPLYLKSMVYSNSIKVR